MAGPLFGAQTQSNPMESLLPLMAMSQMQKPPAMAMTPQQPTGTPTTFKPSGPSISGAPPAPTQSQVGGKTLLGQ